MTLYRLLRLLSYALMAALLQACADTKSLQEISNVAVPDSSQLIIVNVRKPATGAWQMGSGGKPYGTAGGYDIPLQSIDTMAAVASDYHLSRVDGWPIDALGFYCEVLRVRDGIDVADVVTKLKRDPRVAQVQRLNHFNTLTADNDPYFHVQYPGFRDALSRVHEHYAGEGVDIVVIDTGVDITHPDLKKNIVSARNFIDSDNDQFVQDIHGTAVSGIIGAEANNNIGIVGIAPKSRLHVFKACHQQANNVAAGCNSFGLARALASAIAIKPDIVNLSLTGPDDELLSLLIAKLISADTLVIAAVDDGQADGGFPASVHGVIAASAAIQADSKTISAPAAEEISTRPHAAYDFYSGSSIAAAYVSGVAALLREAYPQTARSTLADWLQTDSTVPCPFRDLFVAGVNEATSCK